MIEESNVRLSKTRHLGLKIGIFGGSALILATLMILYAFGFLTRDAGYRALYPTADKTVDYADGLNCAIYLEGSSFECNQRQKRAVELYSSTLKKTYKVTDPSSIYEDVDSLASINTSPNKEITLSKTLYGYLAKAKEIEVNSNYSLFSAPLFDEWQRLISLQELQKSYNYDPINDADEAKYLSDISSFINDPNHISLTLLGEEKVRLNVSEEYLNFRQQHEISSPLVSFGSLRGAIEIETLIEAFENEGFHDGFFSNQRGLGATLDLTPGLNHVLQAKEGSEKVHVGNLTYPSSHAFCKYSRFLKGYSLQKGEDTYNRSLYLNLSTGEGDTVFESVGLCSGSISLWDLTLLSERMCGLSSVNEASTILGSISGVDYIYATTSSPNIFQTTAKIKEKTVVLDDKYQLIAN